MPLNSPITSFEEIANQGDLNNKTVFIREDLNVPLDDKQAITNDERIKRALPTIQLALEKGAKVIVASHLGRPTEGEFDEKLSLAPVAKALEKALSHKVRLTKDYLNGVSFESDEIILLENLRFNKGEKANDPALAKQLAGLADIFVMDAFAAAHRAHASTCGIAEFSTLACAGPLLMQEIDAIGKAMQAPKHPVVAIVGGSKVSSKITLIETLMEKVDVMIVGGGIANTFIAATGRNVGTSLYEADWLDKVKHLFDKADKLGVTMPIPKDVVVAEKLSPDEQAYIKSIDDIGKTDAVFDIGPETAATYANIMLNAGTIIWNGPVGVFEVDDFADGTKIIGEAIAKSDAFSIAGGGDTLAALAKFNIMNDISYVSTGGGAFLEFIEKGNLPAITILQKKDENKT